MRTILHHLALAVAALAIGGCTAMPGRQAVDAANVVYTEGASHHMIAAQVPVDAARVFESYLHVANEYPGFSIITRKDDAMLLEITKGGFQITGQVTALGPQRSLLYIWADAGNSGYSGKEISERAVAAICEDLGVSIERVDY